MKSVDEFVFAGMHRPTLWTQHWLMSELLNVHELLLAVVVVLTAYRMIICVDFDIFQALTTQRELMIHLRTLKRVI